MKIYVYYENKNEKTYLDVPEDECTIMIQTDYKKRLSEAEEGEEVLPRTVQEILDEEINKPTFNNNQTETRRHYSMESMCEEGMDFIGTNDVILESEKYPELYAAIAKLKPEQQELLRKVFYEEIQQVDIAKSEGVPRDVIISRLVNPTLYNWQDADIDLPPISAKISAVPPVQLVYSNNTEMNDSTILGIESVEIDSDDNTLFAFSFDGGTTWKAYTEGKWAVLSEETSGMNRESIKAVGTDAWNEAAADRQYKIRFALREGGYVNKIVVHYLN